MSDLIITNEDEVNQYRKKTDVDSDYNLTQNNTAISTITSPSNLNIDPTSLTPNKIMYLQRTIGNQGVLQLLKEKKSTPNPNESNILPLRMKQMIQRDDDGVDAPTATEAAGDVSVRVGLDMTSAAGLRVIYQKAAEEITEEALRMVRNGTSVEDAARWATEARNELKVKIRVKGHPVVKGLAEARNIRKYGNKVGPSYDDLIRQGKTPDEIIGSAGRSSTKVNKAVSRMRLAGRFMIAIDVAIVTWEVVNAEPEDRVRTGVAGAAGVGGALAGGWAGAKGGAAVGGFIGAFFGGVGAPVGAAIGGVVGGIGGAIAGGWAGRELGEAGYDFVEDMFAEAEWDSFTSTIDDKENARIKQAAPPDGDTNTE